MKIWKLSIFFYKVLIGYFGPSTKKHWSSKLPLALTLYLSLWKVQIFSIHQLQCKGRQLQVDLITEIFESRFVEGHLPYVETDTWNADWMAYYNHLMNLFPPNWDLGRIYSSSTNVIKDEKYNTDVYFSGEGVVLIVDPSVENELC